MTAAVDVEPCALAATAADIICSFRAADLAGWTPPWRKRPDPPARDDDAADAREQLVAWPGVARGKRSRSRSRRGSSPSASAGSGSAGARKTKKKEARRARGSPPSPLDYSAGSGASTSGGEDGAFCSPPPPVLSSMGGVLQVDPVNSKVGLAGRRSIPPVPPPRPTGQRPRKKMRLPEIQQMMRSLSVENDALRQEMKALQKACTALSKENGKLETRLHQLNKREEKKGKLQAGQGATEEAQNGFALPDLNLPAHDG